MRGKIRPRHRTIESASNVAGPRLGRRTRVEIGRQAWLPSERSDLTVCDRWRDSFENFYADMGPRPSPGHAIERIDNDRGYEPGNGRWVTRAEQNRNKRNNRFLTYKGETLILSDWARRT